MNHRLALQRVATGLAALTLCFIAGCYQKIVNGEQSVYSFAAWVGIAVIVGGLLGVPVGWLLRQRAPKVGWVLMILAPLLLIIVAPAMYSDQVVVDDQHFEARYGFWFNPSVHNVQFKDLNAIRYVAVRGNRNRISYSMHCDRKGGGTEIVAAGDLVRNAVPEILQRAHAQGVAISEEGP